MGYGGAEVGVCWRLVWTLCAGRGEGGTARGRVSFWGG
jgi:hypothetical protein